MASELELTPAGSVRVPPSSSKLCTDLADDVERIAYYDGYLSAMRDAVLEDGVDVRSYFGWS
jgi:beta-glucosidase